MKEKSFKILKYFNIFLIIISIIAILFLHNFKINKLKIIYETLIKNGDYKIYLKKENNEKLTTNDIEKINTDYRKIIKMTESNHQITLLSGDNNDKVYYNLFADKTLKFIEYTNNDFENINIIGKLPTKPNEVLIHKILADYIIENGILIKNSKKIR